MTTLTLEKQKPLVKISYDDFADNPRGWDNITHMYCHHRNYDLGDKYVNKKFNISDFDNWSEVEDAIKAEYDVAIIEPLSLYDHSLQTVHMGRNSGWDWSNIGFIFMTKEQAKEVLNGYEGVYTKPMQDKLLSVMQSDIDTYNQYLTGDVHVISLYDVFEDDNGHRVEECVDSCCGFYFNKDYTVEDAIKDYLCLDKGEYDLVEE